MDPARYADLFLSESRDQLVAINAAVLALERAPEDPEPVAGLFRAVHSLKGMAATMGYAPLAALAHELESLLDAVRGGIVAASGVVPLLFTAADALEAGVAAATAGAGGAADEGLLSRLRAAARQRPAGRTVRVTLEAGTPLKGVRALLVVRRARGLGEVTATWPAEGALEAGAFDREFTLMLASEAAPEAIAAELAKAGFVERVVTEVVPAAAGAAAAGAAAAGAAGAGTVRAPAPASRSVRVDTRRLDTLLNLVGELVIARDRLLRLAATREDPALTDALRQADRLVGSLHAEILASRLVPVWQLFDRFPRPVRDAAQASGKVVELVMEGRDIELDRSLIEELADPLVHLLRNAVDHGLEPPEARAAAGKPASGRLTLSAQRDRSAVVLRVADDGRGIDRRRVLERAIREGAVPAGTTSLDDQDLVRLIARPGFSTAQAVTDLSGRGVGIDAVIAKVRALGGTVEVRTVDGAGTTVELRLPVTLAIVGAVLAQVGDERYALPMTHVQETVALAAAQPQVVRGHAVMTLRDEVLPLVHLHDIVQVPRPATAGGHVVVLERADRRAGVVVDRLLGQRDIVVKPIDAVRGAAALFSGATILADGAPALILDVNALV